MTNDITAAVERLKELEEKATPGPWGKTVVLSMTIGNAHYASGPLTITDDYEEGTAQAKADAAFIAAARNLLPALFAAHEAQQAEIERLRGIVCCDVTCICRESPLKE